MSTGDLERLVRDEVGALDLGHPGAGRTAERWRALADVARRDVTVARVVEAHVDALSILHEGGLEPEPGALYGVWAAEEPGRSLSLGDGSLRGAKPFCTGAGIVDRALVTARSTTDGAASSVDLVEIDARHPTVHYDTGEWRAPAFASTNTATATLDTPAVRVVGDTGWYLDRVGFWHGACGPAACWAGGILGLVDEACELGATSGTNPHRSAHIGALAAIAWQLDAVLAAAGGEIDRAPDDRSAAVRRARVVRHLVDDAAREAIDRFGRAFGPRPLIRSDAVVRRIAEIQVYVRQCHAERDLETLGDSVLEAS